MIQDSEIVEAYLLGKPLDVPPWKLAVAISVVLHNLMLFYLPVVKPPRLVHVHPMDAESFQTVCLDMGCELHGLNRREKYVAEDIKPQLIMFLVDLLKFVLDGRS